MTRTRRKMKAAAGSAPRPFSRRRFLSLIAAGSAAVAAAPARTLAAAASTAPAAVAKPTAALPAKMRAEIEKQKKNTADALKTIRDYPLPPGSAMAFVFRPMARGRK